MLASKAALKTHALQTLPRKLWAQCSREALEVRASLAPLFNSVLMANGLGKSVAYCPR
jgi:hypothetical protein